MEETLTNYLINVRNDLSELNRVRQFLDANTGSRKGSTVTWRTIEAFNSVLAICSSQPRSQTEALKTIVDSFYYLASNNTEDIVWSHFGFELGVICLKILTAIEQTAAFEDLLIKLLRVIDAICKHNSNVWKAVDRQILNVLINKKFPFPYLDEFLPVYISILKKVDSLVLKNQGEQNLNLLKTLSSCVPHTGDFEFQANLTEIIFLHVSNKKLMENFFNESSANVLFQRLCFSNFPEDCRIYLNALNKERLDKKIFSVCCDVICIGGWVLEPSKGRKTIWLDANKESERLSLECSDLVLNPQNERVLYIHFSDLVGIKMKDARELKGCYDMTIKTQNLKDIKDGAKDVYCSAQETDNDHSDIVDFVDFMKTTIHKMQKKKNIKKLSQTSNYIFIDRNNSQSEIGWNRERQNKLQDNVISSSMAAERNALLKEAYVRLTKPESTPEPIIPKDTVESAENSAKVCSPVLESKAGIKVPPERQEMTPRSFVESLNRHIGLYSPETRHTFENTVDTVEFLRNPDDTLKRSHKLFRSPEKIFNFFEKSQEQINLFEENKENTSPKSQGDDRKSSPSPRIKVQNYSTNSQSEDYFRYTNSSFSKKKPTLPKMKRPQRNSKNFSNNPKSKESPSPKKYKKKSKAGEERPSLLDPNGYAYQRWLKPTTSERSNFWLKKLNAKEEKNNPDQVFDFSQENSESSSEKNRRAFRKATRTSTRKKIKETKKSPLNNIKEILRSGEWKSTTKESDLRKVKKKFENKAIKSKQVADSLPKDFLEKKQAFGNDPHPEVTPEFDRTSPDPMDERYDHIPKCRSPSEGEADNLTDTEQVETFTEARESSFIFIEESKRTQKKRERSEGSSISKTRIKKKAKAICKNFPPVLQRSITKAERKAKHQTEEIIETVSKAADHLYDHVQKKERETMTSYLHTVEVAVDRLQQVDDLVTRSKRIEKILAYYRQGCSVSAELESLISQTSDIKSALKKLMEKSDINVKVDRIKDRLKQLIESEIERSISVELKSRQDRLMRCMSDARESVL